MLAQLTKYLFAHHKVVIPGIGCFELHQHPAQLDFAEKIIHPPYFSIQFSRNDEADEKQWLSLSQEKIDRQELEEFGKRLKQKVNKEEVNWSGVGTLSTKDGKLSFYPSFTNQLFGSVEAHKVIRHQQEHAVLRGEKEFSSTDLYNQKPAVRKRSYFILAAEILAILAIAFILYYFYTKGFHVTSTGNFQKAVTKSALE